MVQPCPGPAKHLTCRVRKQCAHCGIWTEPGDSIWPISEVEGRLRYGHYACAEELARLGRLQLLPPVCKHWVRHGFCLAGPTCFYQHPQQSLQPHAAAHDEGIRAALQGVTPKLSNQEARKANRGVGRRNRVRNNWRAAMFRRWLLDTFGPDVLGSLDGVLDVGGGSGELSFELVNLNHLRSTVLDPRPLNLDGSLRKLQLGMFQRSLILGQYSSPANLEGSGRGAAPLLGHLLDREASPAPAGLDDGAASASLPVAGPGAGAGAGADIDGVQQGSPPPHLQMMLTDELVRAVKELSAAAAAAAAAGAGGAEGDDGADAASRMAGSCASPHAADEHEALRCAALRVISGELLRARSVEWSSRGLRFGGHEQDDDQVDDSPSCQDSSWDSLRDQAAVESHSNTTPSAALPAGAVPLLPSCSPPLSLHPVVDPSHCPPEAARAQQCIASAGPDGHAPGTGVTSTARGVRQPADDAAVVESAGGCEAGAALRSRSATAEGTDGGAARPSGASASRGPFSDDALRALQLLQCCSIVVGMHPDQAAGPIVDLAVALQKPFALVPCCVYAKQFPKRRLSDGRSVRTYEELIRFLVEKDPGNIKVERLPFEGKNMVVYRLPQAGS